MYMCVFNCVCVCMCMCVYMYMCACVYVIHDYNEYLYDQMINYIFISYNR